MIAGSGYTGRFAPSPTGALHAGSLVAALASWLDARAQGGRWLLRIEDVDTPRCVAGAAETIVAQLAALGLQPDAPPRWQSQRGAAYQAALDRLQRLDATYPCGCTRREIDEALRDSGHTPGRFETRIYPGTCRSGLHGKSARATRVRSTRDGSEVVIDWLDRRLGPQCQNLSREVGDFILHRADGLWAYQLAVVVDDADQGISDVVRGQDLADNTARQIHLQRLLGLPTPRYLHTPLVLAADGHKLSKQNGAAPLDSREPIAALRAAGAVLGLPPLTASLATDWLVQAVAAWGQRWPLAPATTRPSPAKTGWQNAGPTLPDEQEKTMTTTDSGLQYEDTTPGTGAQASAGQRVTVHYTGWLHDAGAANGRGTKFDSSKDRGDPFQFHLGEGQVIRGWDEGVQGMQVGGTRVLQIPAELGYGARGAGGVIPPNATLVFEVELLAV